jgi:hypothetical protein
MKSDKIDAYVLAEKLRTGSLEKRIFKAPRRLAKLRELSLAHVTLVLAEYVGKEQNLHEGGS